MTTEIKKGNFDKQGSLISTEDKIIVLNNEAVDTKRIKDELGISIRFLRSIVDEKRSSFIKANKIDLMADKWPMIRVITETPGKVQKSDFIQNSYEMLIPMSVWVLKASKLKDEVTPGLIVVRK